MPSHLFRPAHAAPISECSRAHMRASRRVRSRVEISNTVPRFKHSLREVCARLTPTVPVLFCKRQEKLPSESSTFLGSRVMEDLLERQYYIRRLTRVILVECNLLCKVNSFIQILFSSMSSELCRTITGIITSTSIINQAQKQNGRLMITSPSLPPGPSPSHRQPSCCSPWTTRPLAWPFRSSPGPLSTA